MAMSKSLGMYANCRVVLDQVVERGEASLTFPTPTKANHFRQRSYYFRKLLHEAQRNRAGHDYVETSTPYDHITFSIDPANPCRLRFIPQILEVPIDFPDGTSHMPTREEQTVSRTVTDMDRMNREQVTLDFDPHEEEDDLLLAAQEFAKRTK